MAAWTACWATPGAGALQLGQRAPWPGMLSQYPSTVDRVAFDKTGTLTVGTPRVADLVPLGELTAEEVLTMAAAVERGSEHPVGRSILACALDRGLVVPEATGFLAEPGRGVLAQVEGRSVHVGSPRLLDSPSPRVSRRK